MAPRPRTRTTTSARSELGTIGSIALIGAAVAAVGAKLGGRGAWLAPLAVLASTGAAYLLRSRNDPRHRERDHEQPAAARATAPPPSDGAADARRIRAAMDLAVEVGNIGIWDSNLAAGTYRYNSQLHAIYGLEDLARSSAPAGTPHEASEWLAASRRRTCPRSPPPSRSLTTNGAR